MLQWPKYKKSVEHYAFIESGALDGLNSNKHYSTPSMETVQKARYTKPGDE